MPEISEVGVVLLYVLGMAFIVAEMFLPGVVMGVIGLVCVVGSIWLAFENSAAFGWTLSAITVVSIPLLVLLWVKVLTRVFASKDSGAGQSGAQLHLRDLLGKTGISVTMLRPSGTARIDGKKVDVVTEGELIDRDVRIEVVEVRGNRVVVRAVRS